MASSSNPASLENLPAELKLDIFRLLSDTEDLKAVVHASPACHQAYLGAREEILTHLTFRTLEKRNIDILKPALCVHVSFRYNARPPKTFEQTLRYLWRCMKGGEFERARLSVEECKTLLGLTDCIRFYQEMVFIDAPAYNGDTRVGTNVLEVLCALPCRKDWSSSVTPYKWARCAMEPCTECCPNRWGTYHGFDSSNIFGGPVYVDLLVLTEECKVASMSSWSHGR